MQTHTFKGVATNLRDENGWTIGRYHSTDVIKFNDQEIILDSGGWQTVTTKTRLNQASNQFDLGFSVYQKNFEWFVDYRGQTFPFEDGMTLTRGSDNV